MKNRAVKNWEVPKPRFDQPSKITYEKRDELMCFNTWKFHWCYFDVDTKRLYDQYCKCVMDDGSEYLISIGLMDEDFNQIKSFEN